MDKIREKIEAKQEIIHTNYDLSNFGYGKEGKSPSGKIIWRNRENNLIQKHRQTVRIRDRSFMKGILGTKYMRDKVLHHKWDSWDERVCVLNENEHPNGGIDKLNIKWIEEEEWYK